MPSVFYYCLAANSAIDCVITGNVTATLADCTLYPSIVMQTMKRDEYSNLQNNQKWILLPSNLTTQDNLRSIGNGLIVTNYTSD